MKFIRKILCLLLLCLTVGTNQTIAFENVNLDSHFSQEKINQSIQQIIELLESNKDYIFPEKSKLIISKLKYKLVFNKINELGAFTNELGGLIRNVSGDTYLDVVATDPSIVIEHTPALSTKKDMGNFGFEKIEVLSGNIGYLKLGSFYQNVNAELQAADAFDYLSGTDAIIIDLRDVEGDSISLAQFMMSFFVESNTILSKIKYSRQEKVQTLFSSETLDFDHFKQNYPVYILTSAHVSGSGEFFSYTLKHLSKAVIVGEQTMGVALISRLQKVNEFISINMPIAIPIHPVTKTNWEQEGVVPDFKVDASLSFDLAYKLAKEHLGIL